MNVAVAAARLRIATDAYLSGVGSDDDGTLIRQHLQSAGVSLVGASETISPTSSAHARILADGSASYQFDVSTELPPMRSISPPAILHLGSIGAFVEPGASQALSLLRDLPDAVVTLDPNVRPAIMGDPERARRIVSNIVERADIVKLSDEDASWLYPDMTHAALASFLISEGASLVAITRGAQGCSLYSTLGHLDLRSPRVAVIDTIGAGDTFMAALLARIIHRGWIEILRSRSLSLEMVRDLGTFAARGAAITVSRQGCDPPTAAEMGEWF